MPGEGGEQKSSPAPIFTPTEGTEREDGFWTDKDGTPLPVSASDVERHAYCPMSWHLSHCGVDGEGAELEAGRRKHAEIHRKVVESREQERLARKEMVIWVWWFSIVLTFTLDAGAFFFVDESTLNTEHTASVAKYLVLLALVWLIMAVLLLILPWRRYLKIDFGIEHDAEVELSALDLTGFESDEGEGGWLKAGNFETWVLVGSIAISLHGLALWFADDRNIATFVLLLAAMLWTFVTSWRLHRALTVEGELSTIRGEAGIKNEGEVAYSDDDGSGDLFSDKESGLRGRPDQVVRMDQQLIPVELKTGKVPKEPFFSHKQQVYAYLRLIEVTTGEKPPYGVVQYGKGDAFTIPWEGEAEYQLLSRIKQIQRGMVEGNAHRDHQRLGKCRSCSRNRYCPEKLESS